MLVMAAMPASSPAAVRPDASFDTGRFRMTTRIPHVAAFAYAVTVVPGGAIVIAGETTTSNGPFVATSVMRVPSTGKLLIAGGYGSGSMLAMRLTADGRLDRSLARGDAGGRRLLSAGLPSQSRSSRTVASCSAARMRTATAVRWPWGA
jgi:hypothetical protein